MSYRHRDYKLQRRTLHPLLRLVHTTQNNLPEAVPIQSLEHITIQLAHSLSLCFQLLLISILIPLPALPTLLIRGNEFCSELARSFRTDFVVDREVTPSAPEEVRVGEVEDGEGVMEGWACMLGCVS